MCTASDFDAAAITALLRGARDDGRDFLWEDEVYTLLARAGTGTPPRTRFVARGARPSDEEPAAMPGDRVVLKIVSSTIVHKTDVGGVRIVPNDPDSVRSARHRMFDEVPRNYAAWIERHPDGAPRAYRGLAGQALIAAISADVKGVLQVQFVPQGPAAFGHELIVGLRRTREFGMILSAGLGGTDTELLARRFRKGQAVAIASPAMTDGRAFFDLFRQTTAYETLAGLARGHRRIVRDVQLIACFERFVALANSYSPANPDAPFVIEELEINPFAFADGLMVPLDGMCRFSPPGPRAPGRPVAGIGRLLHPERIGIIGVSATRRNFGRIILENVLAQGFPPERVTLLRDGGPDSSGVACVADLASLPHKLDLLVVAVNAAHVPDVVEEVIARDAAAAVMLIPGGMGETEDSRERAASVVARIGEAHAAGEGGPVFLGANCMGVVSRPGRYDTWFIPDEKLPRDRSEPYRRAAFVSQSGAFMLHRTSQCPQLAPAYMISMGNQTDLTLGDMVGYLKDSSEVDVIAVYAEGFKELDGLAFCRAVREAVRAGKEVVFYKAGRTPEGRSATSGHTASLAGDYLVCENCVRQAGAVVAGDISQFQDLLMLAESLHGKAIGGNRLAAVSGAGFEAVGMADSIQADDDVMQLAPLAPDTVERIAAVLREKRLDALVTIANPLDINPAADDDTHARLARILAADPGVDAVVLGLDPLSPAMHTLAETLEPSFDLRAPGSIARLLPEVARETGKPILGVVDGGRLYDGLRDRLTAQGVPVFPVCDRAVAALARYIQARLHAERLRRGPG